MQQLCLESLASAAREFSPERKLRSLLSSLFLPSAMAQMHPGCGFSTNCVDLSLYCLYTSHCTREGWVPPTPQVHGLCNLVRSELPRVSFFHKNAVNLNKLGQHHLMAMPSQPRPRCDRAGLSVCTLAACPS